MDKYIMALFFPEEASYGFVPYQQNGDKCAFELPLTQVVDKEAWDVAKARDGHHETPKDLPVTAWGADVDQPAFEIAEMGSRVVSELQAMETAAYRRDTIMMQNILQRIKLQIRAIESLVQLQRRAMESANTES
jgi:two-component sensor histidine kinase